MALLKPIVLNLATRGNTAVDYIDYFDEGHYGPDKPHFVGRFDDLTQVAEQIRVCLALQGNEGSMIHNSRHHVEGKWIEALADRNDPFVQKAQYKIRFLIRMKFYGEFAYLDIGKRWEEGEDPTALYYVEANELEVLNRCMLSPEDAEVILEMIKNTQIPAKVSEPNGEKKALKEIQPEKYVGADADGKPVIEELTSGAIYEAIMNARAMAAATYMGDDGLILADDEGMLVLE